ncbi:MAG TPA: acyl-CoA carboxylase subunit epsilon [Nocardioidaceae bacterium]|nr:acyl-CoA carboxylase subunit epsilon [Nocardioidaceae bacterium]
MSAAAAPAPAAEPALLRVIKGAPTDAELAALVGVIAGLRTTARPAPRPRSPWSAPARRVRPRLAPGPGAWRASALPR